MADLLTHVLVPFVVLTVVGWIVAVPRQWIPVAMGGAAIPDLVKLDLLLDADLVGRLLGVPFEYDPVSSVAGVCVVAGVIALLFTDDVRRTAYGFLLFGGVSSLLLDGLRVFADGHAGFWLYPLWVRPPTPSLYVTSDVRVVVVAVAVALSVTIIDRRVVGSKGASRGMATEE